MRKKTNHKNGLFSKASALKLTTAASVFALSLALTFPSLAEVTNNQSAAPAELARTDATESAVGLVTQVQNVEAAATSCADIDNPDGLGAAQKAAYDDRITMIGAVTNTDKLFDVANKNGCFNALSNFPNLSVAIPSLSSIANALKKTMIDYATRKVCNAVNDALTEVITPINEALDKVSKNGQIDMTGAYNKAVMKKLYEIDPELGRVSQSASDGYEWNVSDVISGSTDDSGSNSGTDSGTKTESQSSYVAAAEENSSTDSESAQPRDTESSTRNLISSFFK